MKRKKILPGLAVSPSEESLQFALNLLVNMLADKRIIDREYFHKACMAKSRARREDRKRIREYHADPANKSVRYKPEGEASNGR